MSKLPSKYINALVLGLLRNQRMAINIIGFNVKAVKLNSIDTRIGKLFYYGPIAQPSTFPVANQLNYQSARLTNQGVFITSMLMGLSNLWAEVSFDKPVIKGIENDTYADLIARVYAYFEQLANRSCEYGKIRRLLD